MRIKYSAKAKDGKLIIPNRPSFVRDIMKLEGKNLVVTIELERKNRSNPQNRYYWGVCIPIVKQGLIDAGWERELFNDTEMVHELLKSLFCPKTKAVNEISGEVIEIPCTTTKLTTVGFMDYLADIQRWASEFLNAEIPDPNENLNY